MRRSSLKCNKTGTQSPWKGAFWAPKFLKGSSPFATNFRGQELLVSGVLLDCQEHFLGGTMIIESLIIITVDCIFSGTSWFSSSFFFWNSPHGDPVYEKWKLRVFDSQPPTHWASEVVKFIFLFKKYKNITKGGLHIPWWHGDDKLDEEFSPTSLDFLNSTHDLRAKSHQS